MTKIGWAALVVAVLASLYSIAEAIVAPLIGHPIVDPDSGPELALTAIGVLLIATFALSVAVLHEQAVRIDAGSRLRRWIRRLLLIDLAVCAAVGAVSMVITRLPRIAAAEEPLGLVGNVTFVLAFVLGAALGLSLLRRPDLRAGAICLAVLAALIPVTILMGIFRFPWGHVAYAEAALYIGIALLATKPRPESSVQPTQRQSAAGLTV